MVEVVGLAAMVVVVVVQKARSVLGTHRQQFGCTTMYLVSHRSELSSIVGLDYNLATVATSFVIGVHRKS